MSDEWTRQSLDLAGAPRPTATTRDPDGERLPPFASNGFDVKVWPLAKIVRPEKIHVGNSVIIDDFVFLDGGAGARIGSFVHIAVGAVLCGGGELEIGDFSNVASGARIYTGTDDVTGWLVGPTIPAEFRNVTRAKTTIGRHVQVLANSVVHAGVTLPDGAVIAPGSVVTKSRLLAPWCVYGGVPTRYLRDRFREQHAVLDAERRLLESRR